MEGAHKIAQINDLVRELVFLVKDQACVCYLIIYSDNVRLYWSSASGEVFQDIPGKEFDGRSSLGKAYAFVKELLNYNSTPCKNACIVLISDGEATDNYVANLRELDPKNEITRVGGAIGIDMDTLEQHVGRDGIIFSDVTSLNDRDSFLDEIMIQLKKTN